VQQRQKNKNQINKRIKDKEEMQEKIEKIKGMMTIEKQF